MTIEEPWDELMGPSPEDLKSMLNKEEEPPVRRGMSATAPPPNMFSNSRWNQEPSAEEINGANATAARAAAERAAYRESLDASAEAIGLKKGLAGDDGEEGAMDESVGSGSRIREEALRMLEVADDQHYAVYRTSTGGFSATHRKLGGKRVPAALAGLDFRTPLKTPDISREDAEYGENVVDLEGMEQRFASSRSVDPEPTASTSSWSSRYSVDHTLLALSGGALSSQKKTLDRMDRNHARATSRNLFASSPHETPQVFGSGFAFRQKSVFGKQNVTVPPPNLKAEWMDADPARSPAKSWSEQLAAKNRLRRRYMLLMGALLLALIITFSSLIGKHDVSSASAQDSLPKDAVSFYVTSHVPWTEEAKTKLEKDLGDLHPSAAFWVHLGNMQDASATNCEQQSYLDVQDTLLDSPITTFVVPGEEDWVLCPDPETAWANWKNSFMFFDAAFQHPFSVNRQFSREENFAFVHKDVLFVGLHVVDHSPDPDRLKDNLTWLRGMMHDHKDVRAIVVMGSARPGAPSNAQFFADMVTLLVERGLPSAYVHANPGDDRVIEYDPFANSGVKAIQVENGSVSSPIRLTVTFAEDPFLVG